MTLHEIGRREARCDDARSPQEDQGERPVDGIRVSLTFGGGVDAAAVVTTSSMRHSRCRLSRGSILSSIEPHMETPCTARVTRECSRPFTPVRHAVIASATLTGAIGSPVSVEVHVSNGLPGFTIVGLPDAAVRESRDKVRAAILSSGLSWPLRRTVINLAPARVAFGNHGVNRANGGRSAPNRAAGTP
jgi:hypothetical protein